ncbi:hypothetical protein AHAS_Ahas18G0218600 [Arachis hypogaea]
MERFANFERGAMKHKRTPSESLTMVTSCIGGQLRIHGVLDSNTWAILGEHEQGNWQNH